MVRFTSSCLGFDRCCMATPPPARSAVALEVEDNPQLACDRAAARAGRDGHLPDGLLAAIATVESGRRDASGLHRYA